MEPDRTLLKKAWECRACQGPHEFESTSDDSGYFKFPPIIGAQEGADILFAGIKPRRSKSNLLLHDALMGDFNEFVELARNRVKGEPYIGYPRQEEHYRFHYEVIEVLYGKGVPFENHAAVTELWLCAAVNKHGLPKNLDGSIRRNLECRERFLLETLKRIRPRVIIALGKFVVENLVDQVPDGLMVEGERARCSIGGRDYEVIHAPHPGRGFSWSAPVNVAEKARMCL
jgi:uracil-DNA glycosylase